MRTNIIHIYANAAKRLKAIVCLLLALIFCLPTVLAASEEYKTEYIGNRLSMLTGVPEDRILSVPQLVVRIGEEAFASSNAYHVSLPPTVVDIAPGAFSHMSNLRTLIVPETVVRIGEGALPCSDRFCVLTPAGSYAARYCAENGINCYELENDRLADCNTERIRVLSQSRLTHIPDAFDPNVYGKYYGRPWSMPTKANEALNKVHFGDELAHGLANSWDLAMGWLLDGLANESGNYEVDLYKESLIQLSYDLTGEYSGFLVENEEGLRKIIDALELIDTVNNDVSGISTGLDLFKSLFQNIGLDVITDPNSSEPLAEFAATLTLLEIIGDNAHQWALEEAVRQLKNEYNNELEKDLKANLKSMVKGGLELLKGSYTLFVACEGTVNALIEVYGPKKTANDLGALIAANAIHGSAYSAVSQWSDTVYNDSVPVDEHIEAYLLSMRLYNAALKNLYNAAQAYVETDDLLEMLDENCDLTSCEQLYSPSNAFSRNPHETLELIDLYIEKKQSEASGLDDSVVDLASLPGYWGACYDPEADSWLIDLTIHFVDTEGMEFWLDIYLDNIVNHTLVSYASISGNRAEFCAVDDYNSSESISGEFVLSDGRIVMNVKECSLRENLTGQQFSFEQYYHKE